MSRSGCWQPTQIEKVVYGPGTLSQLPELVKSISDPTRIKVLIVTGNSLATKTPVIKQIEGLLGKHHAGTFTEIGEHAPIEAVNRAVELVKKEEVTVLVSVGGGSPIDAAKVIAHLYHKEGGPLIPSLAIPTTLSAAELTPLAGYTVNKTKTIAKDSTMAPKVIIYDPELAIHTPIKLWVGTGMRALDHGMESLYRMGSQVPIKRLAVEAIKDLFESLPASQKDPKDVAARGKALIAAWMSIFHNALSTPYGLSHALGYQLGAPFGIPHGECSALTLPGTLALFADSLPADSEALKDLASLADALKLTVDIGDGDRGKVKAVAQAVKELVAKLGFAKSLNEYGVPKEALGKIAENGVGAMKESMPDGLPEVGKVEKMLEKIYS